MKPIPLPAPIHYELPLRVLEQETLFAVPHTSTQRAIAHELVITLRKALALQKRLEASCQQDHLPMEYRWHPELPTPPAAELSIQPESSLYPPATERPVLP